MDGVNLSANVTLSDIIDAIFEEVASRAREQQPAEAAIDQPLKQEHAAKSGVSKMDALRTLTEDDISKLHFLFGKNLERAMEILDLDGVRKVVATPSGRSAFQVLGKKGGEKYICFPRHYCSCQSFYYDVVSRNDHFYCKHQLAARLAEVLGFYKEENVSETQMAELLLTM